MTEPLDELALADHLCANLLSAADLKELCRSRGFSHPGGTKEALTKHVASRLLDPRGLAEALAGIEGVWLVALHLLAAAARPMDLAELDPIITGKNRSYRVDHRALWREACANLLCKGVLLADEKGGAVREKSRFARLRLILPSDFRPLLPPSPIASEPVSGVPEHGDSQAALQRALAFFVSSFSPGKRPTPRSLTEAIAHQLSLKDGRLSLRELTCPDAEKLERTVLSCWEERLAHRGKPQPPVAAGRLARHLLDHLRSGHGCAPASLARALQAFEVTVSAGDAAAFLEEGAGAGALARHPRAGAQPLFAPVRPTAAGAAGALVVAPQAGKLRVDLGRSSALWVLTAAAGARATIASGALLLEADPVQLGKSWGALGSTPAMAALRAASPAFDAAAQQIEERRGQVLVHRHLAVLRVDDVGLHALLRTKFPAQVRELSSRHLAVLEGKLGELLALAGKEGFVARRLP